MLNQWRENGTKGVQIKHNPGPFHTALKIRGWWLWCTFTSINILGVFTLGTTFCNLALQQVCNWTLSCDSQLQPVATGELRVGPHEVLSTCNTRNSPKLQLDPIHPRVLIPPNSDACVFIGLLVDSYHAKSWPRGWSEVDVLHCWYKILSHCASKRCQVSQNWARHYRIQHHTHTCHTPGMKHPGCRGL